MDNIEFETQGEYAAIDTQPEECECCCDCGCDGDCGCNSEKTLKR